MNNTTYTANENCFLIDGEVYAGNRTGLFHEGREQIEFTHSTKVSEDYILLPRDKFVKPKDVEKTAIEFAENTDWIPWSQEGIAVECFKAGHNANPNEFTRDDMELALVFMFHNARNTEAGESSIKDAIYSMLRPLTLPASVEINEQGEIVNVIW